MGARFVGPEYPVTEAGDCPKLRPTEPDPQQKLPFAPVTGDAPLCSQRGSIMSRNGACYQCGNCGRTSGCS
jgi:ribonucleoside-diphosphate reductase alpha chain